MLTGFLVLPQCRRGEAHEERGLYDKRRVWYVFHKPSFARWQPIRCVCVLTLWVQSVVWEVDQGYVIGRASGQGAVTNRSRAGSVSIEVDGGWTAGVGVGVEELAPMAPNPRRMNGKKWLLR